MINTKRPSTDDYTQVGFVEAKDTQGNYRNIDHIYDTQGNIVFQQGYLNEYQGADNFSIPAIGKPLLDYTIYGNTVQSDTPTPDNPIMPQGTGERTGNLLDPSITRYEKAYSDRIQDFSSGAMYIVPIKSNTTYTLKAYSNESVPVFRIGLYNKPVPENGDRVENVVRKTGLNPTATITNTDYKYLMIQISGSYIDDYGLTHTVLNVGSTPLPYEPYGYKLTISSANTTTPVYLGEVETTRKIKRLVLTGEEAIVPYDSTYSRFSITIQDSLIIGVRLSPAICSHYQVISDGRSITNTPNNAIYSDSGNGRWFIKTTDITTVADLKSYLAQQYAAGTPVTVWYVLAEPTTGIVNEPLMKIGDYADTLSMEQAGVSIPTLNKPNNTVIDVETEVEPSEVDVTYRGSTKPKYDLFLANNGDSFEAKDGQSLYIGGDL